VNSFETFFTGDNKAFLCEAMQVYMTQKTVANELLEDYEKNGAKNMKRDIVVIGASAGGVETLIKLVRQLPADFPASLFIVLHIPADSPSLLAQILDRSSQLTVVQPTDHTPIATRYIYVAPPDHHMLLEKDEIRIIRGPKENRHRPAIDPLFRSAALAYGPRVIGVILTGALDDGTAGLLTIKHKQGLAIVQDPKDALYPSMPQSALSYVQVDHSSSIAEMGQLLINLVEEQVQVEEVLSSDEHLTQEVEIAKMDLHRMHQNTPGGIPSAFSCPECGGVLWELQEDALVHYRCRIGHAFSPESIQAAQAEKIEEALWTALKTLQEKASLTRNIQQQAQNRNQYHLSSTLRERIEEIEKNADILSSVLQNGVISAMIYESQDTPHLQLHIDQSSRENAQA
jgi:two-component system chemotaxis response regulator CheB